MLGNVRSVHGFNNRVMWVDTELARACEFVHERKWKFGKETL
jgi:hypothetical protein